MTLDSFGARGTLGVGDDRYRIWQLAALEGLGDVVRLPYSIKILLENLLRHEDGTDVSSDHIAALSRWPTDAGSVGEVAFSPERVLLQDRGSSWQNSGVHEPARRGTLTGLLSAQVGLPVPRTEVTRIAAGTDGCHDVVRHPRLWCAIMFTACLHDRTARKASPSARRTSACFGRQDGQESPSPGVWISRRMSPRVRVAKRRIVRQGVRIIADQVFDTRL